MKLTLRTVAGAHFERCVELSSTVGSLKSTLVEDYDAQTLGVCYNGSLLDDDHKTLAECGMADDCWAVVVGVPLKPSRRTLKTVPLPSQLKLPDLPPASAEANVATAGRTSADAPRLVVCAVLSVDGTQNNVSAPFAATLGDVLNLHGGLRVRGGESVLAPTMAWGEAVYRATRGCLVVERVPPGNIKSKPTRRTRWRYNARFVRR